MLDDRRLIAPDDDPHGIEPAAQGRPAVTVEPESSDPLNLAAFLGGDRLQGVAVTGAGTGLYFDEGDEIVARHYEIDLAATEAVITRQDRVAKLVKMSRGQPLAQNTQVAGRGHGIRRVRG